ncbi:hypothetical protein [Corynebacterium uterequi]|uniref:Uncharacterized protein n=1 Tax=Corynebacterium uterequi TaxID=1072256 RepID=A0A0G3HHN8_9CORY|nr:hypothetical protein [Corynebacterium uterequi]AKK10647.1 hypothetical protein CUTER_03190 [Corynebacterium uterequi]
MNDLIVSFAVRNGRVVGLRRLLSQVSDHGQLSTQTMNLLLRDLKDIAADDVRAIIRARTGEASVSRRPLVPQAPRLVVSANPLKDQRERPNIPGADASWLSTQLQVVTADGAHEGLLHAHDGGIVGALGAALVVVLGDTIAISSHPDTTPSVILDELVDLLRMEGIAIRHLPTGFTLAQLRTNETWLVSPVSGVRRVDSWLEYGTVVPAPHMPPASPVPSAEELNAQLTRVAEPVAQCEAI